MALCAVLALITGLLYARYAARFANGFAAELRLAEYAAVQKFDFANLDHFSSASLVTRMTTDATVLLNAINAGRAPLCAAGSCWPRVWAWHFCSAPS